VIPQDGAGRRNQEERKKKVSQQTSRQRYNLSKKAVYLVSINAVHDILC